MQTVAQTIVNRLIYRTLPFAVMSALATAGCSDDDSSAAAGSDTSGGETEDSGDPDVFPGLTASVQIVIDTRGIPHIYGQTDFDVMYASGYQMATDRMFQMDIMRRRALGRQAEILGAKSVGSDELSRLMNFAHWGAANVDRLREEDPDTLRLVTAWIAGVNARVAEINDGTTPLPYGFGPSETDSLPESWTLQDHSAIAKLLFFGSTNTMERELLATIMARTLPESFAKIELSRPMFPVATMPPSELPSTAHASPSPRAVWSPVRRINADAATVQAAVAKLHDAMDHVPRTGSNNWAVDGRFTDTGRPYIAGDPHQPLDSPSVMYAQHLSSIDGGGSLDVIGFSFAGAAGLHLGHNRKVQWTATVNFADVMDIWEVALNDDVSVTVGNDTAEIVERRETILVRGEETQTYIVQDVPGYGVILPNDLVPLQIAGPGNALLFNWIGFAGTTEERAFMHMATAESIDAYEDAVDLMTNGAFNFIAADANAISYRVRIDVPDRGDPSARQMPFLVVDGNDAGSFWNGTLPAHQIPSSRGGERGWLATANNDPWGFTFDGDVHNDPWYYGYFYAAGHRAQRIEEELTRLTATGPVSREDMQALQLDTHSVMADTLVPMISDAWESVPDNDALERFRDQPELEQLVSRLTAWDRQMLQDSPDALVFHVWLHLFTEAAVGDELSILYTTILDQAAPFVIKFPGLAALGSYPESDAILGEGRDYLLLRALEQTAAHLEEVYGSVDAAGYTWGERHGTFFDNPFGADLELGYVSTPGGEDTINVSSSTFLDGAGVADRFDSTSGAVYRLVTTFAEDGTPQAWVNFPAGNVGDPASAHWDDTLQDWVDGTYTRLPFTRAEVDAAAETIVTLEP